MCQAYKTSRKWLKQTGHSPLTSWKYLKEEIEKYNSDVRLTPNQNIILCNIRSAWRHPITTALTQVGLLHPRYVDPLNLTAMECPALPLCPLAITETERGISDLLKWVRAVFEKVGPKYNESVVIWVTGCPNGYARPYMAGLGLVDDGPNSYQIRLGGTHNQTSLVRTYAWPPLACNPSNHTSSFCISSLILK